MKVSRAFLALALCAASMHGAQAVHSGANVRTNALESESFAMQSGVCGHEGCSKINPLNRKDMNDCKCDRAAKCADTAAEEIVHKHENVRTIKESLEISLSKKYTLGGKQTDGNDDLSGCTGFRASEEKSAQAYARIALSLYELKSAHDQKATELINAGLKNHPDIKKEVDMRLAMLRGSDDYLPGDADTDGCAKAFKLIKDYYTLVSKSTTPQDAIEAQQDALRANLEFTPGRFSFGAKRDLAACTSGEKGKAAMFKIAQIINDIMLEKSGQKGSEATFLKQKVEHTSDTVKDIIMAQLKAFDMHPAYKLERANEVLRTVQDWAKAAQDAQLRAETAKATASAPETEALAAADAAREVFAAREAVVQQLADQQTVQGHASKAVEQTKVPEIRARMELVLTELLNTKAKVANEALEDIIKAITPLIEQAEAAAASKAQAQADAIKTAAGKHLAEANRLRAEAEGFKAQVDAAETSDAAKNPQQELDRVVEALRAVLQEAEASEKQADALFHGTVERAKIQAPLSVLGSEVAADVLKIRNALSGAETAQREGAQKITDQSLKERRQAVMFQYEGVKVPLQDMKRRLPLTSPEADVNRVRGRPIGELELAWKAAAEIENDTWELEGPIKALQDNPDVSLLDAELQAEIKQIGDVAKAYRETVDKYEDEVRFLFFEQKFKDCPEAEERCTKVKDCLKIQNLKDRNQCNDYKRILAEKKAALQEQTEARAAAKAHQDTVVHSMTERMAAEREAVEAAEGAKEGLAKLKAAAANVNAAEGAEGIDEALVQVEAEIKTVRDAQASAAAALGKLYVPPGEDGKEKVQDLFTKKAQKAVKAADETVTEAEGVLRSAQEKAEEKKRAISAAATVERVDTPLEDAVEIGSDGGVSGGGVVLGSGSPKRTLPEGARISRSLDVAGADEVGGKQTRKTLKSAGGFNEI